jgi:hypothetical protein
MFPLYARGVGDYSMKLNIKRKYEDLRKSEYPKIEDQLDMLYKDKVNGTNLWFDKIKEIKDKHPKV